MFAVTAAETGNLQGKRNSKRSCYTLRYGVGYLLLFPFVGIPVPCGGMVVSPTLFLRTTPPANLDTGVINT